ncbi:MAG: hypothetical protein ACE5J6_03990 [Candidatus Bathyarchaeia archaeon]
MSDVNWGNYAEAYQAIHDKLGEVLNQLSIVKDATKYLPVRLTDGTSFYIAGGGAGGGLVQVQIRNAADTDWINEPYARDILDRADRLLGRIYGSQGQQLLQRATTYDLIVQLRHAGGEIDPRNIRALASSDVVTIANQITRDADDHGQVDVLSMPNVVQAEKDRTITDLPKKGTPTRIDLTTSAEIVPAPAAYYHLELRGFVISVDTDEIVRLRWGGATGPIIAMLPTRGILAMNLVNIDEKGGGGTSPQNLYLEKTGTGNCQGTVWTETVAD